MSQKGMTLVEIVIALVIFGTGILSVLTLLTYSINTSHIIANKTQATLYAKEAVELVSSIRDTNLLKFQDRQCATPKTGDQITAGDNNCQTEFFSSGKTQNSFLIATSITGSYEIKPFVSTGFWEDFSGAQLYRHTLALNQWTGSYVDNDPSDMPTHFARFITFTGVANQGAGLNVSSTKLLALHVTVLYDDALS